jgi:NAD+ synthase
LSAEEISNWIKEKVDQAGAKGAVVGLSGGIDSSLVGVLTKKALGENVLGVIMPCHSDPKDPEYARELAQKFNISVQEVDLSGIYDSMMGQLPEGNQLAKANLKPRLRMATLYYFANLHGYLVVGTDNKSESFTGYFTKYGDGGVDILPISHLLKTEVRQMARELGVPEGIINKPPSAGLWDGQTDESEMGITYEELDKTIKAIESGSLEGVDPTLVEKARKMNQSTEHKRMLPPSFPE